METLPLPLTRELVLIGDESHAPYDRPPLSKQLLAGTLEPDAATRSAVLAFQGDYGLVVDGIIGPETERAISAAAESINPEQS